MDTPFQMQDPTLDRSFRGHKDVITDLCFKPSMTQLASGSLDHSVMIWNFKPQLRAFRFVGHKGPVTSVDFSPSGHLLASASFDKTVRLWTPNVKGDVTVFKAHTATVRTVRFSGDGESILTCSDDKTLKLWSTHRTKFQYTLAGHLNWVRTARFSPDARMAVSGSDDKTVKLWDLRSKTCAKTYVDHNGIISCVAFHPGGTVIASASTDRSIKLFDVRTHKLLQHYGDAHVGTGGSPPVYNDATWTGGGPNSINFGGLGGEWLISTGVDGAAKIWDLKEGHLFYTLHGHKHGPTTAGVFSKDGDFFATGGSDAQVIVWKSNFDFGTRLGADGTAFEGTRKSSPNHHTAQTSMRSEPVQSGTFISRKAASMAREPETSQRIGFRTQHSSQDDKENRAPEIIDVGAAVMDDTFPVGGGRTSRAASQLEQEDERAGGAGMSYTASLGQRNTSEDVIATLQHLVGQMDVLTQTMTILEQRLTMNEDRVAEMATRMNEALNQSTAPQPVGPSQPQAQRPFPDGPTAISNPPTQPPHLRPTSAPPARSTFDPAASHSQFSGPGWRPTNYPEHAPFGNIGKSSHGVPGPSSSLPRAVRTDGLMNASFGSQDDWD
ncbi:WD40-repeat-containing domain protein [Zopfochytrium polystomum]|nr:WD40-repeat-containing domain protein [Zopfochytrium polystomum]